MTYANFGCVKSQRAQILLVYPADERSVTPKTVFMVFDVFSYEHMTGEQVDLTGKPSHPSLLITRILKGKAVHYQWARLQVQGKR